MKKDYPSEGLSLTVNEFKYLNLDYYSIQENNKIYIGSYNG